MRTRLLETALLSLLFMGLSGIARAQRQQESAQPPPAEEPRLILGEDCSLKCNGQSECKVPAEKIGQHFCDYQAGLSGDHLGFFNKSMKYDTQQRYIKTEVANADDLFANYEREKTALLAETDPQKLEAFKAEALHKKLVDFKARVNTEGLKVTSNFLNGARKRHREDTYLSSFSARIKELDVKLGLVKKETAKKNEEIKKKMDAKLAQSDDNKSQTGRLKGTTGKLSKGSVSDKAALSREMFEGDTRKGGKVASASAAMAPELRNDALAGGAMRGNFSDRYNGHIQDMELGGHKAPAQEHAAAPAAHPKEDNFWVKRVKAEQAVIEDHGTEMMINANRHSDLADNNKAKQDAAASAEWKKGNYASSAWEKAKGWGSYAYHTGAEAGYTVVAVKDAVKQGELDVMRGDPVAVRKVAIGGAAIAAVVTMGASIPATAAIGGIAVGGTATAATVSTAGLVGGGLSATSAYMTTKGITEGSGRIARADSVKEAAIGAAEVAGNALAAPIAAGAGKVIAGGAKAVGLAGPLEKAGGWLVSKGADALESAGIRRGSEAATRALTEKAETVAIQAAEKAAIRGSVQIAEKSLLSAAEHQGVVAVEHAAGGHLAKEVTHFGGEKAVEHVYEAAIEHVEHSGAHQQTTAAAPPSRSRTYVIDD